MTTKNTNLLFLLVIAVTGFLTIAHDLLPKTSFRLVPGHGAESLLFSNPLRDGSLSGTWINQGERSFRCYFEKASIDKGFFCSYSLVIQAADLKDEDKDPHQITTRGVDVSAYDKVIFDIDYIGPAKSLRLFFRNFNPEYSSPTDGNSTKFNAVLVDTSSLNNKLVVPISSKFIVSDWWLAQYRIPDKLSEVELNNIVAFGVDFAEITPPAGEHLIHIKSIEFEGELISKEHWYLVILYSWMIGIFMYAVGQLLKMHMRNRQDRLVIAELSEKNKYLRNESDKFRKLSTVDSLTNTYNRFGVDQIVNTLTLCNVEARKKENAPSYSLIIIDIDHFKLVNDNYGHDVGDRILQGVSAIIKNSVRPHDFVARWGGEEFVIIMPNTAEEFAFSLAEKIRLAVAAYEFEPNNPIVVTVSLGVGEQAKDEEFASCFKRVDTAMYKSKSDGRNRTHVAHHTHFV